jgi:hypothetical protein
MQPAAIAAIIRLSIDPTRLPAGTMSREVLVNWVRNPGKGSPVQVQRVIDWNAVPDAGTLCDQYRLGLNDHALTEQAAIAVMALLIHDLEGGVLQRVVGLGGGGDYYVITPGSQKVDQVEVSGIREDAHGSEANKRLAKKTGQVLTHCKAGFVSVTTFAHSAVRIAHSYLHYVRREPKKRKSRR